MSEAGMELMVPGIGEIVPLDDPRQVALAIDAIRDLKRQLRSVEMELTRAIAYASQIAGSKTLHLDGGITTTIRIGPETVYEGELIDRGLREAGMAEDRIREIVTIKYVVKATEAKRAAGANPAYAAVIDANKTTEEKDPYVTISLKP